MDTDILNNLTDCKAIRGRDGKVRPCHFWYDPPGKCKKPADTDCPEGVRQPQQEFMEMEYDALNFEY